MWIYLPQGFISIVHQPEWAGTDELVVRARQRDTLDWIVAEIISTEAAWAISDIIETDQADYPYRVNVDRIRIGDWVADQISGVEYNNFKSAAAKADRKPMLRRTYVDALHGAWSAATRMASDGAGHPLGRYARKVWHRVDEPIEPLERPDPDCTTCHGDGEYVPGGVTGHDLVDCPECVTF